MRRRRQLSRRGAGAIIVQLGGISLACAALLAGYTPANAQTPDPVHKEKPKAEPKAEPRAEPEAKPEVGPQPDPKARRKNRARRMSRNKSSQRPTRVTVDELNARDRLKTKAGKSGVGSRRKRPSKTSFKADPNAKWACDKQTVVREPIWRGRGTLTYEFFIRNEGTAKLKIKASGG